MNLGLKDKVIIVSGGSKGIGNGICNLLAQEGAIPVILGRNKSDIAEALQFIHDKNQKASYALAELTDPEQCKLAVEQVIQEFGRIDGLVNNAGVNDNIGTENGNYERFMESIKKNLTHYYMLTHYALPELKKSKGSIVNIGSKTSVTGQGGTSGYAAANGGRNALTREWSVELLPNSIRVNAVIVAESFTPLYEKWINTFPNPNQKLKEITDKIPFVFCYLKNQAILQGNYFL